MKPSLQRAIVAPENQAHAYEQLTTEKRAALATWIARTLHPIKAANQYQSSATLPGVFTRSTGGFAVTNGQFKGAMLAAGMQPVNTAQLYWTFHIRRVRV
jgi:hypothetical protein